MRRAGSPVQVSSWPRTAKSTPARFSTDAMDRATLWLRSSRAAVQPTQKSTSACGCSAIVFTSSPSAQSRRELVVPRHGWPRCSMLRRAVMAVSGMLASSITRWRRMSTMVWTCSTPTGHCWTHAPQVRQSHSASSWMRWPMTGGVSSPFRVSAPVSSR